MLLASPDGLIPKENACVEVKCPFTHREQSIQYHVENTSNCILKIKNAPKKKRGKRQPAGKKRSKKQGKQDNVATCDVTDEALGTAIPDATAGQNGPVEYVVNKNHPYYHQMQGQMYFTNSDFCYLVVWTTKGTHVEKVPKDPEWEENIDQLLNFYIDKYLPYIWNCND